MYARDEPAFKAHLYRHHLSGAIVTCFRGMARKVPAFHFILWYVGMPANARSLSWCRTMREGKAHRGRHVLVHHARTEGGGGAMQRSTHRSARPSTFSGARSHVSACGNNGSRSVRSYCGSKGAKAVSLLPSVLLHVVPLFAQFAAAVASLVQ